MWVKRANKNINVCVSKQGTVSTVALVRAAALVRAYAERVCRKATTCFSVLTDIYCHYSNQKHTSVALKKNVVPFLPSTFFFRHFSSGLSAQFLIHTSFCSSHNSKESVFTFIFLTAHSWRGTVSSEAALGLLKQDFSSDNCSSSITLCALPLALCLCMYNNEKGILPLQYIT